MPQTDAAAEGAFRARLEDADDDTGDAILELPLQCLDRLGWEIGDTLSISQDAQGRLILRRISDEEV
ncbi:AbrB/MazE/SpoVT family DNA-binding domain-containing protein [Burkholderia sp. KCJ3K979]|nr:AbrB/MazE/SpoVT family DNA-binding domain-containing protein [Burkholderia sp. KCJ3K979]